MNLYNEIIEKENSIKNRKFTKSEEIINQYIKENISQMSELTITQIAENTHTSRTSVDRYVKKFNMRGFKEFKTTLLNHKIISQNKSFQTENNTNAEFIFEDDQINNFVNELVKIKKENIITIGIGGCHISAQYLARRLNILGFKIICESISSILGMNLNASNLIIISNSGETPLLINLFEDYPNINFWSISQKNSPLASKTKIKNKIELTHKLNLDISLNRDNQIENFLVIEEIFNKINNKENNK